MSSDIKILTGKIKQICEVEGFAKTGISSYRKLNSETEFLSRWIKEGRHADMDWISKSLDKRNDPGLVLDNVKSIISLAYIYDTHYTYDEKLPKISRYAWGKDYHKVLKKKLKSVCGKIESLESGIKTKYYVDDGPVMEKVWAAESGIGWMGKNTNVINPDMGSFFFLSEILINTELETDKPVDDLCETCRICIDACPTGALYEEYKLDSNLCISYQTIENRDEIPGHLNLSGWIFGCDICQDICPFNKRKFFTDDVRFFPNEKIFNKPKDDLLSLTEGEFDNEFKGTPVYRTKYKGWRRNLERFEDS
jgi:epoxyqueuosine reductase